MDQWEPCPQCGSLPILVTPDPAHETAFLAAHLKHKSDELDLAIRAEKIKLARTNFEQFMEFCFKDTETGNPIKLAAMHKAWIKHLVRYFEPGGRIGILGHWGSGKTSLVSIGFTLFCLGNNPNLRIAVVCNTDGQALKRVSAIGKHIQENSDLHELFPKLRPDKGGPWSEHRIQVKRSAVAPEASVEAFSINGNPIGSRFDLIIFDDPVDDKDAESEAIRETRKGNFFRGFMSRLSTKGIVLFIGTRWCEGDLTTQILTDGSLGFKFLVQAVSKDFSCLEQPPSTYTRYITVCKDYAPKIPLWWSKEQYERKRSEVSDREFERGFRQVPFSESDYYLKKCYIEAASDWEHTPHEVVDPSWPCTMGVDLSGKGRPGTVIFTMAAAPDGKKYVKEIRRGNWGFGTEAAKQIIQAVEANKPELIMVENVAAQDACIDLLKILGAPWLPIKGYRTGREKADPKDGVPGLLVQIEQGGWVFPLKQASGHRNTTCECAYCVFLDELAKYPHGFADTTMSMWFSDRAYQSGRLDIDLEEVEDGEKRFQGRTFNTHSHYFSGTGTRVFGNTIRRVNDVEDELVGASESSDW